MMLQKLPDSMLFGSIRPDIAFFSLTPDRAVYTAPQGQAAENYRSPPYFRKRDKQRAPGFRLLSRIRLKLKQSALAEYCRKDSNTLCYRTLQCVPYLRYSCRLVLDGNFQGSRALLLPSFSSPPSVEK
jgi:hypothetical protein